MSTLIGYAKRDLTFTTTAFKMNSDESFTKEWSIKKGTKAYIDDEEYRVCVEFDEPIKDDNTNSPYESSLYRMFYRGMAEATEDWDIEVIA